MQETHSVILTVDDNATNLTMLNEILGTHYKVYAANSGERALRFLEKMHPDIILLDLEMPEMNGYLVLEHIKQNEAICEIPVIFLTGREDRESEAKALEMGAVDYIQKPINRTILLARVKLHLELELYRRKLENLVSTKTDQLLNLQDTTMELLAQVTEFRDKETGRHIKRTSGYVCAIMRNLPVYAPASYHVDEEFFHNLQHLSPLHDIGKVSIPDSILLKPSQLTKDEFELMKSHTISGGELLKSVMSEKNAHSFLEFAHKLVTSHHEKWDGSGYPLGLSKEEIPLCARIMAIADVYDALTTVRPYKKAFTHEEAMKIMLDSRGTHFDPILLDVFVAIEDEIIKISQQHV